MKRTTLFSETPEAIDPEIDRALDPVVERLTGADDARRRAAVAGFLQKAIPPVRRLLIDRLVGVLMCGDKAVAGQAILSLHGKPVFPTQFMRLCRPFQCS